MIRQAGFPTLAAVTLSCSLVAVPIGTAFAEEGAAAQPPSMPATPQMPKAPQMPMTPQMPEAPPMPDAPPMPATPPMPGMQGGKGGMMQPPPRGMGMRCPDRMTKRKEMMMQRQEMMKQHMDKMEGHLANIEALLRELVEQNKAGKQ